MITFPTLPMQPTVLLYHPEGPERLKKIRGYLEKQGIRLTVVPPEDYLQPIGSLLGLPGLERRPVQTAGNPIREEMMLMFGFQGSMMHDFLQFFRQEEIPSIQRKAVATPTNLFWNSVQLYEELSRESEWFSQNRNG